MESVLQKFQAMKEERMRFAYETQSKQSILLSNRFLNTCNNNKDRRMSIDNISKEMIAIQNYINAKDNYRKHFEYYTDYFFQFFNEKSKELFPSGYDFDSQSSDIKVIMHSMEELIEEYTNSLDNNSGGSHNNVLNQIKENCCLLDSMLQVNFEEEKEELERLKLFLNKVKDVFGKNEGNGRLNEEKEKMLKSLLRYVKLVAIREGKTISKSVSYNDNHYRTSNNKESIVDMKIYFHQKEQGLTIKKCLKYIRKRMITLYYITYNKEASKQIKESQTFIYYNIFGLGKAHPLFIHYLTNLLKTKLFQDSLIKCSFYSSIDYLFKQKLSKLSPQTIIHTNFPNDFLQQFNQL